MSSRTSEITSTDSRAARVLTWAADLLGTPSDRDRMLARLDATWRLGSMESGDTSGSAGDELRADLAAQAHPDLRRVHPTWWVRALQEESPAVRLAVAAHAPDPVGEALRHAFGLDSTAIRPDAPAHPEIVACTMALWSERLVGDRDHLADDPPVIAALMVTDRHRREAFVRRLARLREDVAEGVGVGSGADPRFRDLVRQDISRDPGEAVRGLPRLGLLNFARLLVHVDSHRTRWALQHVPYAAAKYIRSRMSLDALAAPAGLIQTWEGGLLEAAMTLPDPSDSASGGERPS